MECRNLKSFIQVEGCEEEGDGGEVVFEGDAHPGEDILDLALDLSLRYAVALCDFLVRELVVAACHEDIAGHFRHRRDEVQEYLLYVLAENPAHVRGFERLYIGHYRYVRIVLHLLLYPHLGGLVPQIIEAPVLDGLEDICFRKSLQVDCAAVVPEIGEALRHNILCCHFIADIGTGNGDKLFPVFQEKLAEFD